MVKWNPEERIELKSLCQKYSKFVNKSSPEIAIGKGK